MNVSQQLAKWYNIHKRILPWRELLNPYSIWLSEIILQQTRINQGMKYYLRFIEQFPTVQLLASAPLEEVLLLWQGLGYYTRARNLHKTAQIIVNEHNGIFPSDYESVRQLPGVGDYTAAAIVSLAYNMPYPAVDGNVYRVLARFFGIFSPVDTAKGKKYFYDAAWEILDRKTPGKHNQAMIELGALVCLPGKPLCASCPISDRCYAFQKNITGELPVKQKKAKVIERFFYYLVIQKEDKYFIRQRQQNDIWAMLYDFPLIETKKRISERQLFKNTGWKKLFGNADLTIKSISKEYVHKLSHQTLYTKFIEIETQTLPYTDAIEITENQLVKYPFPRLIERYLNNRGFLQ